MNLYDIYLLAGTALILIGCVVLFSATVDGRAPTTAIVILLVGFGCIYGASTQKGDGMALSDIPAALGKFVTSVVR
jgi:uncharacterized membrane protein